MQFKNKLSQTEKDKLIKELVAVGAKQIEKPLTTQGAIYSSSIGKKGRKILKIKI